MINCLMIGATHILIVCVRGSLLIQLEEVPEVVQGEVPLNIFLLVNNAATESLLVCLSLEYLLLNRASLDSQRHIHAIHCDYYSDVTHRNS